MKIKEMNINIVLEERWENIKKPEDGKKFLNKILVAAKEELTGKIAAAITNAGRRRAGASSCDRRKTATPSRIIGEASGMPSCGV